VEIKILKEEYLNSDKIYNDFLKNKIDTDNFTDEIVYIESEGDFPIYLNETSKEKREKLYLKALKVVGNIVDETERKVHMDPNFWYSYLLIHKRDYLLKKYPQIKKDISDFKYIILKKFDLDNYIYKLILASQYIMDNIEDKKTQEHYFGLVSNNLDMYNNIIKYEIFRNGQFLVNVLGIIDKNNISDLCKKKIANNLDKKEARFGRQILFELHKMYPTVLSPMMNFEDLEQIFLEFLKKYSKLV